MKCSKCGREAIIFQRYSGLHLCEMHFNRDVEQKARRAIRKNKWIVNGDRIAVALSGGKDSSAVLYFMSKLLKDRPDVDLCAINIDEGIAGYRYPEKAKKIADSLDVPFHSTSFSEEYGITLDRIVELFGDRLSCTYCGILRRTLMNRFARNLGMTKIAFGMNLDDEAQSVMLNVLRGDERGLITKKNPHPMMVPRIKPFIHVPERDAALYAFIHTEDFDLEGCPYSYNALRNDVRGLIDDYTSRHPSTKHSIVKLGEKLPELCETNGKGLRICPECGEACGDICRTCQIIREVKKAGSGDSHPDSCI